MKDEEGRMILRDKKVRQTKQVFIRRSSRMLLEADDNKLKTSREKDDDRTFVQRKSKRAKLIGCR